MHSAPSCPCPRPLPGRDSNWLGALIGGWLLLGMAILRAGTAYQEAPELARLVAEGKLPPVEERLPRNPMLVQPLERAGPYGGTLHSALMGWSDQLWLDRTIGYEPLVRWDSEWHRIIPNLAQRYEVNSNATEFVFYLRSGLRWSDGAIFTADDVLFWYEVIFRANLLGTSAELPWCYAGGEPVQVEKRNAHTVLFRFRVPNGTFLYGLAGYGGDQPTSFPRHFLGRYHPQYNPAGIEHLLAQAKKTDWVDLLKEQLGCREQEIPKTRWRNPWLPTLHAWQLAPGSGIERSPWTEARRNPFYWKVDTEGRQLPYIDRVYYHHPKDIQELLELGRRGQLDLCERQLTSPDHLPLLEANREAGDYRFYRIALDVGNLGVISLNMNHRDPSRRQLFQDKNFRIGLSCAIDRPRIIREVLKASSRPFQAAPRPESPFYHDRLATQYTAFDPGLASQFLDRAGLRRRDTAGRRQLPDGTRLLLRVDLSTAYTIHAAAMSVIQENWAALGIEVQLNPLSTIELMERKGKNQHDAVVWGGDGGLDVLMDPRYYLPLNENSSFAVAWARWRMNPHDPLAEEPPEEVRRQIRLYGELTSTAEPHRQHELVRQILDIAADQFYAIGLCLPLDGYGLAKNHLRNVPSVMMSSGQSFLSPAPLNPCQFFIDDNSVKQP